LKGTHKPLIPILHGAPVERQGLFLRERTVIRSKAVITPSVTFFVLTSVTPPAPRPA
jgi:hypothetical protein